MYLQDYDKDIGSHLSPESPLITDIAHSNHSSLNDTISKDAVGELEFYTNLAKAASLASQTNHGQINGSCNGNDETSLMAVSINASGTPPGGHGHPAELPSPNCMSPSSLQVNLEERHANLEEERKQHLDDNDNDNDNDNDCMENDGDDDCEIEPDTITGQRHRDQTKESALAAAAAAAQAHLNGTSEYISISNFIYLYHSIVFLLYL